MQQQQFYLTLPSNSDDFDSNKTSNFRVRLPHPLELSGEWECGLAQIDYPHSFNNITTHIDRTGMYANEFVVDMKHEDALLRFGFRIPVGSYDTIEGLLNAIYTTTMETSFAKMFSRIKVKNKKTERPRMLKWFMEKKKTDGAPFFMHYDRDTQRIHFRNKWGIKRILFSPTLQYILGISAVRSDIFSSSDEYIADYPPDLTAGFNTLYIYCNLVEPQIVGNSLTNLIRTVALTGKQGDFVTSIFQSPHYVKLQTRSFDTVNIAIKDDQGEDAKFNFGKVIVKLHLRRIK
jgi:hypothetical protein